MTPQSIKPPESDNANFVQVSRSYLKQIGNLSRKNPAATQILFYLVETMGRTTNAVVCSYKVLQEVTGLGRTSVATAIKVLKNDNWIDAVKIGNATAYAINERVFWQAGKNQRKYAVFSATVVASESEQPSDFQKKANEKLTYIPFVESPKERILIDHNEPLEPPDQKDFDLD